MNETLVCWKCGAPLTEIPLPFGRTAECPRCRVELHVCRMCEFFDPTVAQSCREPVADVVKEKERANFCDYFRPAPDAYQPSNDAEASAARAQLEALFGGGGGQADGSASGGTDPEIAEALERLFRRDR